MTIEYTPWELSTIGSLLVSATANDKLHFASSHVTKAKRYGRPSNRFEK